MPIPREQLRLDAPELEKLLAETRELHVATVSPDGVPHVVPLWYVWHGGAVWVNSLIKSRRTRDVHAGSPVALCIDTGFEYEDLRGAVLRGRFVDASEDSDLGAAQAQFAAKYWGGDQVPVVRSHIWMKLVPEQTSSWDFRKIPAGRDKRLDATRAQTASQQEG
ncbi:MAG: pyridoxamine 5'-phosphate oxidase family protein [Actinomycetota bacterium]|nr:pyridoxamine 5'-phosphate oxidase family protein [Actinomycetota bacterium]